MLRTVLIADDDPSVRELVVLLLERAKGFEVLGARATGPEALRAIEAEAPDIVLLDLKMPGVSGHEILPEIMRAAPETMVVVVSGYAAEDEESAALEAGAYAYLEKQAVTRGLPEQLLGLHARFIADAASDDRDRGGVAAH